ncbi:MAG: hypothetical protein GX633_05095 [Clostridiales bacterium]|nr:hypothetical protein [Clostridiales bacterium]
MSYINPAPIKSDGYRTPETERIYKMLMRFIKFPAARFHLWDVRPNCGYFFTGCHWYGTDQNEMALITAFLAKYGDYDEELAEVFREKVHDMAIRTLRYSCFTHDTGPEDCIRVMGRTKQQAGTKWGGNYVSWPGLRSKFFQSSQVGVSISYFGLAAWILWEDLDEETRQMAYNVITDYARRWAQEESRDGVHFDTQAEENGWTGLGIFTAAAIFPDDPEAKTWREGAIRWILDAATTPLDMYSRRKLSDGTPLRSIIDHITIHPDYTTENHRVVHPDYLNAPLVFRARMNLFSALSGAGSFPGIEHNWENIYGNVFKPCASFEGGAIPIQSQDWWYYKIHEVVVTHTASRLLFNDPYGALLEKKCLDTLEATQLGHSEGTFMAENTDECIISSSYQILSDFEPHVAVYLTIVYLYHMCLGEGVKPSAPEEFESALGGVRNYPFGGSVIKRGERSFSAFTHRNCPIAFTLPEDKMWTITVPPCSAFGCMKFKDDCSEDYALSNQEYIRYSENTRIYHDKNNFAASATIDRGLGRIKQDVSFITLPDESTVYFRRVRAIENCSLEYFTSGLVGIRNEYYVNLPQHAAGYRMLTVGDNPPEKKEGYVGGDDVISDYEAAPYVALDDKISYLLHGSNGVRYVSHHNYPKWKGIEDFLVLDNYGEVNLKKGEQLPLFLQISLPNKDIEYAKAAYKDFYVSKEGSIDACILSDRLIYSSFINTRSNLSCVFELDRERIPLFEGSASYRNGKYTCSLAVEPRGCGFKDCTGYADGGRDFDSVVLPDGTVLIRYAGETDYHDMKEGEKK